MRRGPLQLEDAARSVWSTTARSAHPVREFVTARQGRYETRMSASPIAGSVPSERVVFESAFEGLFVRALLPRFDAPTIERLRAAGLDLGKKLQPAYQLRVWVESIDIAAAALFPDQPRAVALRTMGKILVTGFQETLVGRALFATLRLIGMKRALARTTKNFRSANNYTDARLTELAPTHFHLWMNINEEPAELTEGIVQAALTAVGGKNVALKIAERNAEGVTFDITWD